MSEEPQDEYKVNVRRDETSVKELQDDMERTSKDAAKKKSEVIDDPERMLEAGDEELKLPASTEPTPTVTPTTPSVQAVQPVHEHTPGGTLVLQWLSYAFWFWYGVSMSWLAGVVINYFVTRSHSVAWAGELAYPLAAVIVMMVITLVTDWFYTKHEPARKTGGANVIMLLHAVPFVLISIGSLITVVFALLTMVLNSNPVNTIDGPLQVLLVALVVAIIFGLLAFRIVFGGRKAGARKLTWIVLGVLALGFIAAAFAGPAMEAARTKQDRLIEMALPSLSEDIRSYAQKNDKLPAALTDVSHTDTTKSSAVQMMIDQKLVTYKPNTLPAKEGNTYTPGGDDPIVMPTTKSSTIYPGTSNQKRFYYQLCTTYRDEKKSESNYTSSAQGANYTTDMSAGVSADYRYDYVYTIASHPSGQVCYNLYADGKYTYNYAY
jgi:hypothetical protein